MIAECYEEAAPCTGVAHSEVIVLVEKVFYTYLGAECGEDVVAELGIDKGKVVSLYFLLREHIVNIALAISLGIDVEMGAQLWNVEVGIAYHFVFRHACEFLG